MSVDIKVLQKRGHAKGGRWLTLDACPECDAYEVWERATGDLFCAACGHEIGKEMPPAKPYRIAMPWRLDGDQIVDKNGVELVEVINPDAADLILCAINKRKKPWPGK